MTQSWNRYPIVKHDEILDFDNRYAQLPHPQSSMLAFGNGRSYGDVCLNENASLIQTRRLNKFIAFDKSTGRITCETGVLLKHILDLVVPQGWFLAVTPGTRYVSVGGAIANDVHGKNHHVNGSFGHHLCQFELLRSNGERILCSPQQNPDWFRASIGGLGLTGMITWAELQLIPIANPYLLTKTIRFKNLQQFWQLNADTESSWPYTVAWIDCVATGKRQGRGLLMLGQHAPPQADLPAWANKSKKFPVDPAFSLVNGFSLRAFNTLYYHLPRPKGLQLTHYVPYFYPLDSMLEWNRIYGNKGFFQYQCVIPPETSQTGIQALLDLIANSGSGSFLAVLKVFGEQPSTGMLSFPRPGATLALDFPNQGQSTLKLFNTLDAVVSDHGGAIYPAKDARMPALLFQSAFPLWEQFSEYIDPQFSSSFWRRVT
jgi:FAD/FMN-containing dehydrogenase